MKYLDPAALEKLHLDKLQQPNRSLPRAGRALLLGRGDAWVAVGMAETLRSLPKNHPRRAHILKAYWKIRFLLKYQAAEGMWRHLIDLPGAWPQIPFCPPPRDSVSEVTSTKLHRCGLALSSEVPRPKPGAALLDLEIPQRCGLTRDTARSGSHALILNSYSYEASSDLNHHACVSFGCR